MRSRGNIPILFRYNGAGTDIYALSYELPAGTYRGIFHPIYLGTIEGFASVAMYGMEYAGGLPTGFRPARKHRVWRNLHP